MSNICVFCNGSSNEACCATCTKLSRSQQFVYLLNKLQEATAKPYPHDELVTIDKRIKQLSFLTEPITYTPLKHFDPDMQHVDQIAQTYLLKCQCVFLRCCRLL